MKDELENINEVLLWRESDRNYDSIADIWMNIDEFIKNKHYHSIRLYWWQYLATESQYRGKTDSYIITIVEIIDTCLCMGAKKQAEEYFNKAFSRLRFLSKPLQERLEKYRSSLSEKVKASDIDSWL